RQAWDSPDRTTHSGFDLRFEPVFGRKPSELHQEHDQHAGNRRGEPDLGRHERRSRQPSGPADPSAAVVFGTVHGVAAGSGRSAAPALISPRSGGNEGRAYGPPFSLTSTTSLR